MTGYIRFHGGSLHNQHLCIRSWGDVIEVPVRTPEPLVFAGDLSPQCSFERQVYRLRKCYLKIKREPTIFYEYVLEGSRFGISPDWKVDEETERQAVAYLASVKTG